MEKKIGDYCFIVGVIIAVVLGLASSKLGTTAVWLSTALVVLGLIVGFLNVSGKETKEFLMVTVALVIVAYAGGQPWKDIQLVGQYLSGVFNSILAFVVPASVVVALKEVWELAKGEA